MTGADARLIYFAANWPEYLERLVVLSVAYEGGPNQPVSPVQRKAIWYQWFFGMEQGAVRAGRRPQYNLPLSLGNLGTGAVLQ